MAKTGAVKKDTVAEGAKAPEAPPVVDEAPVVPMVDPEDAKAADKKVAEPTQETAKKADRNKKDREARAAKAKAEAEAGAKRGHYVRQGTSLTSNYGPVVGAPIGVNVWEGAKVTPKHWTGDVFKRLKADGAVVEVK